jgi:hypothetical protein
MIWGDRVWVGPTVEHYRGAARCRLQMAWIRKGRSRIRDSACLRSWPHRAALGSQREPLAALSASPASSVAKVPATRRDRS